MAAMPSASGHSGSLPQDLSRLVNKHGEWSLIMRKMKQTVLVFLMTALIMTFKLSLVAATEANDENLLFEDYKKCFDNVYIEEDIALNGFLIAETTTVMADESDLAFAEEDTAVNSFLDAAATAVDPDEIDPELTGEDTATNGLLDTETAAANQDEIDPLGADQETADEPATEQIMVMMEHAVLGNLKALPAIHQEYNRLALFFVTEDGAVVAKTDDFISNTWLKGQIRQTNRDLISLSCFDLNGDGLDDIIIISACRNDFGIYADKIYPVADVLFQNQQGFYRDPRISDKLNRFDMNKTDQAVLAFVRDDISMEFLFTAKNLADLLAKGFRPISSQCFTEYFEKFGVVDIICGFFNMAGQNYLMVYIVDKDGKILWNFQPMHYYVNFYAISALSFRDIDGDGNKDLLLIGNYVTYDEDRLVIIKKDYDIYYQRAGYFLEDMEFKQSYYCQEEDTISTITKMVRQYWGWPQ